MQTPAITSDKQLRVNDDQVFMICVAIGYPDDDFPVNEIVSKRKSFEEAANQTRRRVRIEQSSFDFGDRSGDGAGLLLLASAPHKSEPLHKPLIAATK